MTETLNCTHKLLLLCVYPSSVRNSRVSLQQIRNQVHPQAPLENGVFFLNRGSSTWFLHLIKSCHIFFLFRKEERQGEIAMCNNKATTGNCREYREMFPQCRQTRGHFHSKYHIVHKSLSTSPSISGQVRQLCIYPCSKVNPYNWIMLTNSCRKLNRIPLNPTLL